MQWYLKLAHQAAGQYCSRPWRCSRRRDTPARCGSRPRTCVACSARKSASTSGVRTQLEAVDRRIAGDHAPGPLPVVDDEELARLLRRRASMSPTITTSRSRNSAVPRRPCRSASKVVSFFQPRFGPPSGRSSGGIGRHCTSGRDAGGVVGQADEVEVALQVARAPSHTAG